ncbi:MAG: RAMP superfamily CRISPR-associated protein, partial [Chitinophagales bacterium]|nr:RAMP superfamily CRISPR-associated protein [Chitinophagales bacterium]
MIQYKIEFLSEWHIGSGLGAGAAADATVLLDTNKMPYIPGKTIKGLLKDTMKDIEEVQPNQISADDIKALFGLESNSRGVAIFSDCTL